MKALNRIIESAKVAAKRKIVLPEGIEKRVMLAAVKLKTENVAEPILLGNKKNIQDKATELGVSLQGIEIINPVESELLDELTNLLFELRQKKGMTMDQAQDRGQDAIWFANLMVKSGHADGCVSGSVFTTADVVRTALQVIGPQKGSNIVSSFFLMMLCEPFHTLKGGIIFSDCALVVNPDVKQLSEIAMAAANSAKSLLMEEPQVAMLSFSTDGSANHSTAQKVVDATDLVNIAMPDLAIDGGVQLDAAIVSEIADRKIENSNINGKANVLVFPNLDAGNIGYKLAERIGGAKAIGPILQGLAKPANDLSRGCSVEDIYNTVAVTVMQANIES